MAFGKLCATKNLNMAVNMAGYGSKVIYGGDPEHLSKNNNFVRAGMIIPDFKIMSLYIEGDMQGYIDAYKRYLNTPEANELFATLIGSLFYGNNVVIYFPPEVEDLGYPEILLRHLAEKFGIMAETKSSQFMYDQNFHQSNLRLMYLYNVIDVVNYIMETEFLDDMVINKIKSELPHEWGISPNCDNERFTELLEDRKNQIIKYGKVGTVLVSEVD